MNKRIFLAVSLCAVLFLAGCQNHTTAETEWSELWGNSGGNILQGGYIAANSETLCYTNLNGTYDNLYKLDEKGEPVLLPSKLAYNLNMVNDRVYFVSGFPGPIRSIRTDGTGFTTLVRGEYHNLFVSQTHMAYLQGSKLVVSDITGGNKTIIASNVREFLPFKGAFMFTTVDGLYRVNPDGTAVECLFDEPPVSLCANSTSVYFSVSNDMKSFGKAGGRLYQIDEEGTISQLPTEYECWNMNASDDYLFFRNQSDMGALYRMDLDGGNARSLLAENCSDVNVIGNSVVFRVITKGKGGVEAGYYILEEDGSDLRSFDGLTISRSFSNE
ncbi:MAG: DUF5050 domain-containing protein [Oscillibacter sp.]|nr:DUF5050 domain-containing protein [Oscillibacter sp.]